MREDGFSPHETTFDAKRWWGLAMVLTATFMTMLDSFIVNVAAPSIQEDLQATSAEIQFVIVGYILSYGVLLVTGGRLGDIYGKDDIYGRNGGLYSRLPSVRNLPGSRVVDYQPYSSGNHGCADGSAGDHLHTDRLPPTGTADCTVHLRGRHRIGERHRSNCGRTVTQAGCAGAWLEIHFFDQSSHRTDGVGRVDSIYSAQRLICERTAGSDGGLFLELRPFPLYFSGCDRPGTGMARLDVPLSCFVLPLFHCLPVLRAHIDELN